MRRHASALVLAALLLAGCGGGSEGVGEPEAQRTTGGQTTYKVDSAEFSIAVPESWKTISADEFSNDGGMEDVIRDASPAARLTYRLRRGRRTSSPPQFGQTPSSSAEHDGQNVHS